MDLAGKVIVITGAAQGLGQKMAEIIAGQGAKLALVDLDHAKLQNTVRLCTKLGGKVKDYPADVTDEPAVEALFSSVHKDFGSVDGLINNAGITSDALLVKAADGKVQRKMSLTDFDRVIAVDEDIVNVEGGAIAHGHPIGATGAVLTTRLLHSMKRDGIRRGVVTLCIGGGQGIALTLEAVH